MPRWIALTVRLSAIATISTLLVGVGAFVGVRLAKADPSGPPTTPSFTFAGVLRNPDGGPGAATMLTFTFRRNGFPPCTPAAISVTPNGSGAFTVPVPIIGCPSTFFDGTDVTYEIRQAGESTPIASDVAITPVPYARFADQVGFDNDCPAGYAKSDDAADTVFIVCRRPLASGRFDEVVKVGRGASSFWIDRYESSVWDRADTSGSQMFDGRDSTSEYFPKNGQWRRPGSGPEIAALSTAPAHAWSVRSVQPATLITWYQAMEACANSGKRLPTGEEWLRAAQGTDDPGNISGSDTRCRTNNGDTTWTDRPRNTGLGVRCRSGWGAQDMIGNIWEMTAEWFAGSGAPTAAGADGGVSLGGVSQHWSPDFNGDLSERVLNNQTAVAGAGDSAGFPAVAMRGGNFTQGFGAGIFAISLYNTPTVASGAGFRCVIPR